MLSHLLFERNDICEIHDGRSRDGALHEFQPNGQSRARAGFLFPK